MNEFKEAKEIYEDQIKEISEEIADSDNQLFINIQSSQLANIYSSLTDIYKEGRQCDLKSTNCQRNYSS